MMHQNLDLSTPRLMAIVNATPDSFSDGGELFANQKISSHKISERLEKLVEEGADILDIGGESTRPGAEPVTEQQELDRVMPVIEQAVKTDLAVSIDTSSPLVMKEAASSGVHMINDVRALTRDGALEVAINSGLPVCLMHMQGSPESMQQSPNYKLVINEVAEFLQQRAQLCLDAGVDREKIWLDPGFGFGKTLEHNLTLLAHLKEIKDVGFPVLAGLSRKSMIGHLLDRPIDERLPASLALGLMALERGAHILRVHDVAATRDMMDVFIATSRHK